nr:charged multivesicular body protein 4c [Pelodiscus sinensis]|eukprot:XP_014435106.1 charged multivesicular body protein 4c [Pelodiscus sinensis]
METLQVVQWSPDYPTPDYSLILPASFCSFSEIFGMENILFQSHSVKWIINYIVAFLRGISIQCYHLLVIQLQMFESLNLICAFQSEKTVNCVPSDYTIAALQALKRKKKYEKQLSQIDGTLSTIEFQREALENSHTNTEVFKNMGYAAQAMKKVHENMDLDKIDSLMDDVTEQQAVAQEISEAISNRVGFGDEFDEDELMAELEELEQEELNKKMTDVRLPSVPSTSLPTRPTSSRKKVEDDDDMKQLAAWAS